MFTMCSMYLLVSLTIVSNGLNSDQHSCYNGKICRWVHHDVESFKIIKRLT